MKKVNFKKYLAPLFLISAVTCFLWLSLSLGPVIFKDFQLNLKSNEFTIPSALYLISIGLMLGGLATFLIINFSVEKVKKVFSLLKIKKRYKF